MKMQFQFVINGKVLGEAEKEYDTPPLPNDPRLMSDLYSCEVYGSLDPLKMAREYGFAPWVAVRQFATLAGPQNDGIA